jgi:F0F1-type ATP synthase membrane subunit b/b'
MEPVNLPPLPASSSVPRPPKTDALVSRLPEDLLQQLHDANDQLHDARVEFEKALNNSGYRHQERIDQAAERLREAERYVEEITAKIDRRLRAIQS